LKRYFLIFLLFKSFLFYSCHVLGSTSFHPTYGRWRSHFISAEASIGHNSIVKDNSLYPCILHLSCSQISPSQISSDHIGTSKVSINQFGVGQIGSIQAGMTQVSSTQIDTPKISVIKTGLPQMNITEVSGTQINSLQVFLAQLCVTQVNAAQVNFGQLTSNQLDSTEISFPSSITLQQFLNSYPHLYTSALINTYKDNPLNLWQTLFDPANPFDLTLQIKDLPTGQLAEAQITKYDQQGRPNGGTILIDNDANGVGWFIDPTPEENSEFSQTLTDTAFRATTGEAFGKYDLLTSILHEMGHLAGIIAGNPGFDSNVQTINGVKTFVGNNFTATLTPDGSHLDSKVHPYDLMNNTLAPGVRKLPSWLNLQMVNAIRNTTIAPSSITQLKAPLSAILLADITNGNFNETNTTKPEYGWSTRGAATILNQEAVLTEDSPFNSNFSQSFIIPEGAKYLQFTLKNTTLGANTPTSPGDAFEVALLNANTKQSLINTVTGLTQTDSLLNIQNDGIYYSNDKVKLINTTPNPTFVGTDTFTYTVTDSDGLTSNTATVNITVNNIAPVITVITGDTTTTEGTSASFNATATDPGILDTHTIDWDFGDGNTTTSLLNPSHIYTQNGSYTVTLTITDKDGAVSNDTITVTINKPPTISLSDISIVEGDNNSKYAVFTATLSEASLRTITANYSTSNGTATEGSDYTATNGTITFCSKPQLKRD
jgi:PKD repeat protein